MSHNSWQLDMVPHDYSPSTLKTEASLGYKGKIQSQKKKKKQHNPGASKGLRK